jgi:HPt (histidine-containing phosphotransfer) domain-containing protein
MSNIVKLTEDQKLAVTKRISEGITDYVVIAGFVFNETNLTGRSWQSRLIRDFMIDAGVITGKKQHPNLQKRNDIPVPPKQTTALNKEHMEFIDQNIKTGISIKNIAQILFHKEYDGATSLNVFITPQYRAIHKYVKEKYPEFIPVNESEVDETYAIPRIIGSCIKKVNKWTGKNLNEESLSMKDRRNMEKLLLYLQSPRFVQIYNSYVCASDKEMFESEYVRATHDKADLTVDEVNLYIGLSMDYVLIKQINEKKNKLNQIFHETEGQHDMSMKLTEMLKSVSEELNQTSARIEKTIHKLNGSRSERLKHQLQSNASILSLVELFQDEKERTLMVMQAELQKKLIGEEADKLESMSAWKARVLGISKEDAI